MVEISGETLTLFPERGLYWERKRTLFIADTHFGKTATFRARAIPLPEGSMASDLQRLSTLINRIAAHRLIVLGDLLHAPQGRDSYTLDTFSQWRSQHADLAITLIRGNHDRSAGDPPQDWNIDIKNRPSSEAPFILGHEPFESPEGYVLSGHLHPAAQLTGKGQQTIKLPCFWFGKNCAVLPAFGSFTAGAVIKTQVGDQVFVIANNKVMQVA